MNTAYIVDAMSVIRSKRILGAKIFGDLKVKIFELTQNCPDNCSNIHFVGDMYNVHPERSCKLQEEDTKRRKQNYERTDYTYIPNLISSALIISP